MTGPERKPPDDQLLDDFLAGRGPVSQAYRDAAHDTTPPALDQAVLQMAHEELLRPATATPRDQDHFRDRRWPFGLAAVLVLSFSTLLLIREDPGAQKAAMMPLPEAPVGAAAEADIVPPPPAAAMPERAADAMAPREESAERALKRKEPAAPAYAPAPVQQAREAEAAPPEPQMAAPAPPSPVQELRRDAAGSMAAPRARGRAAPGLADNMVMEEKMEQEAPEAWLERIRRLLSDGRRDEARRELEAYLRMYPDAPVPEDLRGLR